MGRDRETWPGTRLAARVAELRPTAVNAVLAEVRRLQADGPRPGLADARPARHADARPHRRGRRSRPSATAAPATPTTRASPACAGRWPRGCARDHGLDYDPDREILITDGATLGLCRRAGRAGRAGRRRPAAPTRSTTPTPRRSPSGAAAPSPIAARIRDGRFAFGRDDLEPRRDARRRGSS